MIVLLTTLPCICILEERLPHVALDRLDCTRPLPHLQHLQYREGPPLPQHRQLHQLGAWGLFLPGGLVFQG